jgi:pimeloyl-ACP methyl ester carboxylesterase
MATIVTVHGGWGGGWEWAEVAGYLRAAGHEVFTPTLTGMGERSHLAHPAVDLDTHIQDVVNVFTYEDLHDVVLSGHSYGGMVVTGVADRVPERISRLIYVDAFVPEDGQSIASIEPEFGTILEEVAREQGDGWRVPPLVDSSEIDEWAKGRYGPQPIETMRQPVRLTNPARASIPHVYIACTERGDDVAIIEPFARMARASDAWEYHEIATIHDPQAAAPRELADVMLAVLR